MEPKPTYEAEAKDKVKAEAPSSTSTSTLTCAALPAATLAERWWLAFTPDHEPTAAAARFIERTGAPPEYLVKTPTMLLVGPLIAPLRPVPQPEPAADTAPLMTQLSLL